jgi:hypothetical protein
MMDLGIEVESISRDAFEQQIDDDRRRWGRLIGQISIKID